MDLAAILFRALLSILPSPALALEAEGFRVDRPGVSSEGLADAELIASRFTDAQRWQRLCSPTMRRAHFSRCNSLLGWRSFAGSRSTPMQYKL